MARIQTIFKDLLNEITNDIEMARMPSFQNDLSNLVRSYGVNLSGRKLL